MAGEGMMTIKAAAAATAEKRAYCATKLGFVATGVAVGAALHYFPAAEVVSHGLDVVGAVLLFLFLLAVAGVNLITAGLCPTLLRFPAQPVLLRKASISARNNVPLLTVSAASAAATGVVVAGAAHPALCFLCFTLLLLAVSVAAAGLARDTR